MRAGQGKWGSSGELGRIRVRLGSGRGWGAPWFTVVAAKMRETTLMAAKKMANAKSE